jgi:Tfp pilus assembly protein PilZ
LKKRSCDRFSIPGTTLCYKHKSFFLKKHSYSEDHFPVINMSRGGAKFLCNERLQAGKSIVIKVDIPGRNQQIEILADVRWISKNPEQSYRYQTGIAFNAYGNKKNENPMEILALFESLE